MKTKVVVMAVTVCLCMSTFAWAESFRYNGKVVHTGDSKTTVLAKFGEPALTYSEGTHSSWRSHRSGRSIYTSGSVQPVTVWVYQERGKYPRMLKFVGGRLSSIAMGRSK